MKKKYTIEYNIQCLPGVLFEMIGTPWGLSQWFADDVIVAGDIYTFKWDGEEEQAQLIGKKEEQSIRFRWIADTSNKTYFEFTIEVDELTHEVDLEITDFAEEQEIQDAIELWNTEIAKLKHIVGSH